MKYCVGTTENVGKRLDNSCPMGQHNVYKDDLAGCKALRSGKISGPAIGTEFSAWTVHVLLWIVHPLSLHCLPMTLASLLVSIKRQIVLQHSADFV